MAFTVSVFARTRPYLYHLTAAANHSLIERRRRLESASVLRRMAGQDPSRHPLRTNIDRLNVGDLVAYLRDQRPLWKGRSAMVLTDGWTIDDLRLYLDNRVFFWPGRELQGPVDSGWGHYETYRQERPLILRVRTESMVAANPSTMPEFSKYNSGAPRDNELTGKSPRGPGTFLPGPACTFRPSEAVECTFVGGVRLPADVEVGSSPSGPWRPFFGRDD